MADALDGLSGTSGTRKRIEASVRTVDEKLRLAVKDDAAEVYRLHTELADVEWDSTPEGMDKAIARFLGRDSASFIVVAERAEGLGGFVVVHALPAVAEGSVQLFVDDIYVEDELRGTGLGSRLLAAVAAAGTALGACMTFLHARKANEVARRFYAKNGLTPTDDIVFESGVAEEVP